MTGLEKMLLPENRELFLGCLSGECRFALDNKSSELRRCNMTPCSECMFNVEASCFETKMEWLKSEIPEVDWTKVPVDKKILVRESQEAEWIPRYFARYEDRRVFAWKNGATSFSALCERDCVSWPFAKLYVEGEDE